MLDAYILVSHGTVDDLADLPAFICNIRRGHDAPAEMIAEVTRRYAAVGGSPLNRVNRQVAELLEGRLRRPVRVANRLWHPYPRVVLSELREGGAKSVGVIALAQHSAHIYNDAVREAAQEIGDLTVQCASNWGQSILLTQAIAAAIEAEVLSTPDDRFEVVMTAHSLPVSVVRAGDPYEDEVRLSAASIAERAGIATYRVAFQSQGMSAGPDGRPVEWLGPNLVQTLDDLKSSGNRGVVVAPIGFLADHTEILYDIDVEMRALAEERGMWLRRTASLNATPRFVDALEDIARKLGT